MKILSLLLYFTNVYSQIVGGSRDENNCLISAGYSWCESSNSCIRSWETPCRDHYTSCDDCLNKQRKGMNIACPMSCDIEEPISIPLPPPCPEVMCMMYCENGFVQDSNGCNTCRCNEPMIAIDPIPSMPPVINPFLNTCSVNQMAVYHECNSDCHNCDFKDTRNVLNDCMNNNILA